MDNKTQNSLNKIHTVQIFARERIDVVGVLEVLSSTEKEVIAKLENDFLTISGSGMSILKLIPDEGLLSVSGNISGLSYVSKLSKKSFFGKVFK